MSTSEKLESRFGVPNHPMTEAIRTCLNVHNEEVIGVLAQLACVDDKALSTILAAAYHSSLQVRICK